ncbi:hypothetical protein V3C99_017110, partial [Haemonchus contortus]
MSSYGSIVSVFALFMFLYVLIESFFRNRIVLIEKFINRRPEYSLRRYVFGHSYQSEIYFSSSVLKN